MNSIWAHTWVILRNDLRLLWREATANQARFSRNSIIWCVWLVAGNIIGLEFFRFLRPNPSLSHETMLWLVVGFQMLIVAGARSNRQLFDWGDFELLGSSPISAITVLFGRLVTIMVATALIGIFLTAPAVTGAAIVVSGRYAWGYAVTVLVASAAASVTVWLVLLVAHWTGQRQVKLWSKALIALATLGATLLYWGRSRASAGTLQWVHDCYDEVTSWGIATLIARAGRGEFAALLECATATGLLAVMTASLLGKTYVTGMQQADSSAGDHVDGGQNTRFANTLGSATFRKEWRLIARDPALIMNAVLSVCFIAPIAAAVVGSGKAHLPVLLGALGVFTMVTLGSQLTTIVASGEEGWDLIGHSPASPHQLRIAKMAAAMLLPSCICALIAVAIAGMGRPWLAALSTGVACLSAWYPCWVEALTVHPTSRTDLIRLNSYLGAGMDSTRLTVRCCFWILGTACVILAGTDFRISALIVGAVELFIVAYSMRTAGEQKAGYSASP